MTLNFDGKYVSATNPLPVTSLGSGSSASNKTATIANGASLSAVVDLGMNTLEAIHMPALWTTANITFQGSEDGVTYDNLYDRFGTETNYTVAAARIVPTMPSEWVGIRYLKVRSGTAGVPVNQGASRAIILITKAV